MWQLSAAGLIRRTSGALNLQDAFFPSLILECADKWGSHNEDSPLSICRRLRLGARRRRGVYDILVAAGDVWPVGGGVERGHGEGGSECLAELCGESWGRRGWLQHRRRGSAAKSSSSRLNRLWFYHVYLTTAVARFKFAVPKACTGDTQLIHTEYPIPSLSWLSRMSFGAWCQYYAGHRSIDVSSYPYQPASCQLPARAVGRASAPKLPYRFRLTQLIASPALSSFLQSHHLHLQLQPAQHNPLQPPLRNPSKYLSAHSPVRQHLHLESAVASVSISTVSYPPPTTHHSHRLMCVACCASTVELL